jgi:hypothetical protein
MDYVLTAALISYAKIKGTAGTNNEENVAGTAAYPTDDLLDICS